MYLSGGVPSACTRRMYLWALPNRLATRSWSAVSRRSRACISLSRRSRRAKNRKQHQHDHDQNRLSRAESERDLAQTAVERRQCPDRLPIRSIPDGAEQGCQRSHTWYYGQHEEYYDVSPRGRKSLLEFGALLKFGPLLRPARRKGRSAMTASYRGRQNLAPACRAWSVDLTPVRRRDLERAPVFGRRYTCAAIDRAAAILLPALGVESSVAVRARS